MNYDVNRKCQKCGITKQETYFYWDRYGPGRMSICIRCWEGGRYQQALSKSNYHRVQRCAMCGGGPTQRDKETNGGVLSKDLETNSILLCSDCLLGD